LNPAAAWRISTSDVTRMSAPADPRDRLLSGVLHFQSKIYPRHQADYRRLAREGQRPHTLFVTCADSRIDPELITQSGPGDIFVARNIGNLVPPYGEALGGGGALLEYALVALQVRHVVVCGHTDCGAMTGLLHPEKVEHLPAVKSWLRHADAAVSVVRQRATAADELSTLDQLIEENVLLQLHHLHTHPAVAGPVAAGALTLAGWIFDIAHGAVRIYDDEQRRFLSVERGRPRTLRAGG
jgi:carbonic anhydrase